MRTKVQIPGNALEMDLDTKAGCTVAAERHQHKALDTIWVGITQRKVKWGLDADIFGFLTILIING